MKSKKENLIYALVVLCVIVAAIWFCIPTKKTHIRIVIEDTTSEFGEEIVEPQWKMYGEWDERDTLELSFVMEVDPLVVGEYEIRPILHQRVKSGKEYEFEFVMATYTVVPRKVTLVIDDKESVYGNDNVELTATVENTVEGVLPDVELYCDIGDNVGQYPIKGIVRNPNYRIAETVGGTYTKLPRDIEVYVDDKEVYNSLEMPELTSHINGDILEGDDIGLKYSIKDPLKENVWKIDAIVTNGNYRAKVYPGKYTINETTKEKQYNVSKLGAKPKKVVSKSTSTNLQETQVAKENQNVPETQPNKESQTINETKVVQESKPANQGSKDYNSWNSDDYDYNSGSSSSGNNSTRPSQPTQPTEPSRPTQPTEPSRPTQPTEPSRPTQPTEPSQPTQPTEPSQPTQPEETNPPETEAPPVNPGIPGDGNDNVSGGGSTGDSETEAPPVNPGIPGDGNDNVSGGGSTGGGNSGDTPAPPSIPGDGGDNVGGGGSTGDTPAPPSIPGDGGDNVGGGGSTGDTPAPPSIPSGGGDIVDSGVSTGSTFVHESSMPNDNIDTVISGNSTV